MKYFPDKPDKNTGKYQDIRYIVEVIEISNTSSPQWISIFGWH